MEPDPILVGVGPAPLDVSALLAHVEGPGEGGVVLFLGRVRDRARGREVIGLDYEAYGDMAGAEMRALAEEAVTGHGAARVALVHRTGPLAIGDLAVAIAVSAEHRAEAFGACRWLIDELKRRVPIWKKERYADGSRWIAEHP